MMCSVDVLGRITKGLFQGIPTVNSRFNCRQILYTTKRMLSSQLSVKQWLIKSSHLDSSPALRDQDKESMKYLKDKNIIPYADPPSARDVNLLYDFFQQSQNLMVLTGAGMSTEAGIPDYRSPNGAYSTGFKPITHQQFVRSSRARRRYWARSYAGWRRFTAAQPNSGYTALASLEKAGRIQFMLTQNVDRLHHRAGSEPLELHGTVYSVICLDCGTSIDRNVFQDEVKALNPKWAAAIENLECGRPGSDKSFGMQQRPDGDIEIDEKFWEEDFDIPNCHKCNGLLKPDVVFFGDNVPKERATVAMNAAKDCDSLLVLGSSLMTMSAFRLVRAAFDNGAALAAINIGETRADDFVPLKINARCGEILPRVIESKNHEQAEPWMVQLGEKDSNKLLVSQRQSLRMLFMLQLHSRSIGRTVGPRK